MMIFDEFINYIERYKMRTRSCIFPSFIYMGYYIPMDINTFIYFTSEIEYLHGDEIDRMIRYLAQTNVNEFE
jgi:hypothetical protein